ncbi:hypothetical protein HYFRA_00011559 [Hymenoscyphus fraxineus]|uniref:Uncharacterized protein n=1 Tax=Hymenoscyphus fraxineus TaxID=746836 RepID=A0A9N9PT35_9HELO|nr:hypothetical protein HYFRA_00011559 [Hymenoscyphus fraxineus]
MEIITIILLLAFCFFMFIKSLYTQTSQQWWKKRMPYRRSSSSSRSSRSSSPSPIDEKEIPIQDTPPYVFPALTPKTAAKTSMGLKRLEASNWLPIDSHYHPEHDIRTALLSTNHPNVVQCLPGSEAACQEVLDLVTDFLLSRYPKDFTVSTSSSGRIIHNHLTNESFHIDNSPNPLEIAARLAMEDFNILMKSEETGDHHLMASATLFPAGWKLQERIGTSMANLHKPVPEWKKNLGGSVNRYFDHLNTRTSMERTNLFIQTTPHLFVDAPEIPNPQTVPEDLWIRRERQTFRRLERSGAVLFTVRTYMQRLVEVRGEEELALRQQIAGLDEVVREYKGGKVWGNAFEMWCRGRDEMVEKTVGA